MRISLIHPIAFLMALTLILSDYSYVSGQDAGDEWVSLFDGKTLNGWKAGENPETFSVQDGAIVAAGPRAHLFYVGPVMDHNFRDFEFRADVMTRPGSNSGIYFHTEYQDEGWPEKGYEAQVNNTSSDPRRTGSLYAIDDVHEAPAPDNEWFSMYIRVQGRRVVIQVNDSTVVDHRMSGKDTSQGGTFAFQGHDPESRVYFKNVMVKPLKSDE